MSGEISPERLCSMSAEELASKELSEWRMAKAEEMAQMLVLPDTEVDMRRLVKKTHKGEYQVEFERDEGMLMRFLVDFSGSLIIPTDGTDLMQGMMVDELKDVGSLPPVVSLDEFMESLNSEPPFENLPADAVEKGPISHAERPKVVNNSQAADQDLGSPKDTSSKKGDDVKKHEVDMSLKSGGSPEQNALPSIASEVEYIWEGILQLNISSSVTVRGLFQSGEKTPVTEWPSSLEIKGRVRLDAFEKFSPRPSYVSNSCSHEDGYSVDLDGMEEANQFLKPYQSILQICVLQFVLKDKSSENQRADLSEAIDSYVADDRLGFAEPAAGVELYLCPPTSRIAELLNRNMPKEPRLESYNSMENGLIGVVVQDTSNVNFNTPPRAPVSVFDNVSRYKPEPQPEEDDDIPPGFGPMAAARAAKDDDDLPEFTFSGGLNPSVPRISQQNLSHGVKMTQRPVDQVRELIQKYGQSGTSSTTTGSWVDNRGLGIEPWNDEDDDDIPEWRPQTQNQGHNQPYLVVNAHQQPAHRLPSNQRMGNQQLPMGLARPPPGGGQWVQPPRPLHGARWRPY
ncbi:UNVERIFIED_CONTAM: hypothetical protein Sangu_1835400 [Sesamum angustifolium]|uniref:TFIIS central domain-containing protein n=1 Tax=Sesamum angustifolium TaxID=2727405 RepID=A0AAW2M7W2_9LAMI